MKRKLTNACISFMMMLSLFMVNPQFATSEGNVVLSIGSKKVIGEKVKVPITLMYLSERNRGSLEVANGKFTVKAPTANNLLEFNKFEPSNKFNGVLFETFVSKKANGDIDITFLSSKNGMNQELESEIVGYLHYEVSEQATLGDSAKLDVNNVSLKDESGRQIPTSVNSGKVERNLMLGDVVGKDAVTPAAAIRILQHVDGTNPITNEQEKASADVNVDGVVDARDAMLILQYTSGVHQSFLTIDSGFLANATKEFEYNEKIEAVNGKEPYMWDVSSGRLPRGLEINEATGVISGIPTRIGEEQFTVKVTDASGKSVYKEFILIVGDSNVGTIDEIEPITVPVGEQPNLPSTVNVTYKDGSSKQLAVEWSSVDTNTVGETEAKGTILEINKQITVKVSIVEETQSKHIEEIVIRKFAMLTTTMHTFEVNTSDMVFSAKLVIGSGRNKEELNMIYDPGENFENSMFSRGTTKIGSNHEVTLVVYDTFGEEIERKLINIADYLK